MARKRSRLLGALLEKDDDGPSVKGILDSVRNRSDIDRGEPEGEAFEMPSLERQRQMAWGVDYKPGVARTGFKHGM